MLKIGRGFFLLTRPVNVCISFISIGVAILICSPAGGAEHMVLACSVGAMITAAANAINDVYDRDIDRINRPNRPLPSGLITPQQALVFALSLFVVGVIASAWINRQAFLIALVISILLYGYSAFFKRMMLIGNIVVSVSTASAFVFGGAVVGHLRNAIFPAIFAFLMHFGREIIKDMEDVRGDRLYQARTLPIRHGMTAAKWVTTIILLSLIGITLVPYLLQLYGMWYLVLVVFGVNTVLLYTVVSMWHHGNREQYSRLSILLKADMLIGLVAIYAGRW